MATDVNAAPTHGTGRVFWVHARSPLHVGAGKGIGIVDLPIVREVSTNWPYVPGTAIKGVLADHFGADDGPQGGRSRDQLAKKAFGVANAESSNAGSLVFSDARLVCLPVRSIYGTFAWCTSPLALTRLKRDLDCCDPGKKRHEELHEVSVPTSENSLKVLLCRNGTPVLTEASAARGPGKVYFEDLDFEAERDNKVDQWADFIAAAVFGPSDTTWKTLFAERFAIVPDDVFTFLTETAIQVDARIRIDDETKIVAEGQLWYEEALPVETILAGVTWCGPVFGNGNRDDQQTRDQILNKYCDGRHAIQIGGKATVGRGQVQLSFSAT